MASADSVWPLDQTQKSNLECALIEHIVRWRIYWNLLENHFGIYSKITLKFTWKLLGNLLENYLGIYSKVLGNLLDNYLQIYSTINCEEIMLWYIHQRAIFAIRQYRTCGPAHVNKWTCMCNFSHAWVRCKSAVCIIRSYHLGYTGSHPNSEVKQGWAYLVLWWGTTRES